MLERGGGGGGTGCPFSCSFITCRSAEFVFFFCSSFLRDAERSGFREDRRRVEADGATGVIFSSSSYYLFMYVCLIFL